jgi:hypothetical protein
MMHLVNGSSVKSHPVVPLQMRRESRPPFDADDCDKQLNRNTLEETNLEEQPGTGQ